MLTIEQVDHNLKITWSFAKPVSSDVTEFSKIEMLDREALITEGTILMIGEEEIPLIVWRAFLSLVKNLLDRGVQLRFSCTSKKTEEALRSFGFFLLGAVECVPI